MKLCKLLSFVSLRSILINEVDKLVCEPAHITKFEGLLLEQKAT